MNLASDAALYPIVFFDGECGFCDGTVQFLLARGGGKHYRFAPLQGQTARLLLDDAMRTNLDTIVLRLPGGITYQRSTAVIKIVAGLGGAWQLAGVLNYVPRHIRDFFYDAFAKRRYRWFGRLPQCRVPTPAERAAFLD